MRETSVLLTMNWSVKAQENKHLRVEIQWLNYSHENKNGLFELQYKAFHILPDPVPFSITVSFQYPEGARKEETLTLSTQGNKKKKTGIIVGCCLPTCQVPVYIHICWSVHVLQNLRKRGSTTHLKYCAVAILSLLCSSLQSPYQVYGQTPGRPLWEQHTIGTRTRTAGG